MPSDSSLECDGAVFFAYNKTYPMPNADINGIGVITAFSLAAYISFIVGITFYVLGCVPQELLGAFERKFIKQRFTMGSIQDFQRWILAVSEQQMVTALGVLLAALPGLKEHTVVEFQTIVYLGWLASNMHLSTMSILRTWFQERSYLRAFRSINMLILMVLMCVAIFPTTQFQWSNSTIYDIGVCPDAFHCWGLVETVELHWHYASLRKGRLLPQGVLAYFILIISHLWQIMMMYPKAYGIARHYLRCPLDFLERIILSAKPATADKKGLYARVSDRLIVGLYMFMLATMEILGSWAFSQYLVMIHLAWSSFQLFVPRFNNLPRCVTDYLNQWGFGQVLPLVLLLAPLYSVTTYCIQKFEPQHRSDRSMPNAVLAITTGTTVTTAQTLETLIRSHRNTQSASTSQNDQGSRTTQSGQIAQNRQSLEDASESLRQFFYSTLQFRALVIGYCLICCMGVVGFFLSAALALLTRDGSAWHNQEWYAISWRLWPNVMAVGISISVLCSLSITFSFTSSRLRM